MHRKASRSNVGVVGCTLLYGDERQIQHAGVYLVPEGLADHMYVREKYSEAISSTASDRFPYDITKDMPMTAVTGAAQMVEKRKFDELGGLDEKFIICGGDVDLCIRHNSAGYQTWLIGGGYMLHKESVSRKFTPIPDEDFYNSYLSYIKGYDLRVGDPFVPEITKNLKIYGA
jgi:GT2 family glycosyltransferase